MDYRRAGFEITQLANDRFGIPFGSLAARLLPRAFAEQLLLPDDRNVGIREQDAVFHRPDDGRELLLACCERRPVVDARYLEPARGQHVMELFAAARRIGGEQRASAEVVEKTHQRSGGVLVAGLDFQCRGQLRRQVQVAGLFPQRLRRIKTHRVSGQLRQDLVGREESLLR